MDTHRSERVSEALREELGELISYELSDPRVEDATVTDVQVSPDMRHAQVLLQLSDEPSEQMQTIRALDGAKHFLRRRLAERLNLFRVPELHFQAGASSTVHMKHLLKRIRRGRPRDPEPSTS